MSLMRRRLMLHSQSDPLMLTDILCLDGIENTLEGHKNNTGYYWWDLSGNGNNFYRSDWAAQTNWADNAKVFSGNRNEVISMAIKLPNNTDYSIEVVSAPTDYGGTYANESLSWIFSNRANNESINHIQAIAIRDQTGTDKRSITGNFYNLSAKPAALGEIGCQTLTVSNGRAKYFYNGKLLEEAETTGNIALESTWTVGGWNRSYLLKGKVYRIGIHSKAFTASTVASRWRYFQERFGE